MALRPCPTKSFIASLVEAGREDGLDAHDAYIAYFRHLDNGGDKVSLDYATARGYLTGAKPTPEPVKPPEVTPASTGAVVGESGKVTPSETVKPVNPLGGESGQVLQTPDMIRAAEAIRKKGNIIKEVIHGFKQLFMRRSLSLVADKASSGMLSVMGSRERGLEKVGEATNKAFLQADGIVAKSPMDSNGVPMDAEQAIYEYQTTGKISDPRWAGVPEVLKFVDEQSKSTIQDIKGEDYHAFVENYLSQVYKDPELASEAIKIVRKIGMHTNDGFLMERTFKTARDAYEMGQHLVDAGYVSENPFILKDYNPIQNAITHYQQVAKWRAINTHLSDWLENGWITRASDGKKPKGWVETSPEVTKLLREVDTHTPVSNSNLSSEMPIDPKTGKPFPKDKVNLADFTISDEVPKEFGYQKGVGKVEIKHRDTVKPSIPEPPIDPATGEPYPKEQIDLPRFTERGIPAYDTPDGQAILAAVESTTPPETYYMHPDVSGLANSVYGYSIASSNLYQGLKGFSNLITRIQLTGLFHFSFTSLDYATGNFGLGMEALLRGDAKGATKYFGTRSVPFAGLPEAYGEGGKIINEYHKPGSESAHSKEMADWLEKTGAAPDNHLLYTNQEVKKLIMAWNRKQYAHAAFNAPLAASELTFGKVLSFHVPRVKTAAFSWLVDRALKLEPNATPLEQMKLVRQVGDAVDNSFGLFNHPASFEPRILREIKQLWFRASGWLQGNVRQAAGTTTDTLQQAYATGKTIAAGEMPTKANIGSRLPIELKHMTPNQIMMMGRLTQVAILSTGVEAAMALLHHKKPTAPDMNTLIGNPRTSEKNDDGTDERITLNTYNKDWQSLRDRGLINWITGKGATAWADTASIAKNRDWKGDYVFGPQGNVLRKGYEIAKFIGQSATPIALSQNAKAATPLEKVGATTGFYQMATKGVTNTPAMKFIQEQLSDKAQTPRTPQEVDAHNKGAEIIRNYQSGKATVNDLSDAMNKGLLTERQVKNANMQGVGGVLMKRMLLLSKKNRLTAYNLMQPWEKKTFDASFNTDTGGKLKSTLPQSSYSTLSDAAKREIGLKALKKETYIKVKKLMNGRSLDQLSPTEEAERQRIIAHFQKEAKRQP